MKKITNILLIFVMCFVLVGCGKEKEDLKATAEKNVKALAKAAQEYFAERIEKGEGFVWEMNATELNVAKKPSAGKIKFTANPHGEFPIVTATGVVYGDYTCTYENETATCKK